MSVRKKKSAGFIRIPAEWRLKKTRYRKGAPFPLPDFLLPGPGAKTSPSEQLAYTEDWNWRARAHDAVHSASPKDAEQMRAAILQELTAGRPLPSVAIEWLEYVLSKGPLRREYRGKPVNGKSSHDSLAFARWWVANADPNVSNDENFAAATNALGKSVSTWRDVYYKRGKHTIQLLRDSPHVFDNLC